MNEVFTFIDSSHLVAKANLWQERDKAIGKKLEKLNNLTLTKVAYDKQAKFGAKCKNCTLRAILKNNMKNKDKGRDNFISKLRSPYERVFSQTNHRTRYKGIAKNQFALFMASLAFNLKRMVILDKEYGF